MSKPRANLRLSTKLHAELCRRSEAYGVTKTAILEDALACYFDPESSQRLEEKLLARLDAFDERQGEIERDMALCLEALGQFVFYWLARMDPLPDGERDAAQALGEKRFDFFVDQVAQRLIHDSRWRRIDQ